MKDLSFFLLKNSLAAKMKKGLRNFCSGVGSTSTVQQHKTTDCDMSYMVTPSLFSSYLEEDVNFARSPLTLEDMIRQLDLEEAAVRRAKLDECGDIPRRMSCVNNSDILRSARNALNQYPRFSLDGRDAVYRSSFQNYDCFADAFGGRFHKNGCRLDLERNLGLPPTLAGETVVWCKPGVVAQLMGLDAIPLPISRRHNNKGRMKSRIRRRETLRSVEGHECGKRRILLGMHGCGRENMGSCSKANCCVMQPIGTMPAKGKTGWRVG